MDINRKICDDIENIYTKAFDVIKKVLKTARPADLVIVEKGINQIHSTLDALLALEMDDAMDPLDIRGVPYMNKDGTWEYAPLRKPKLRLEDDVNFAPPSVRKAYDDCCHRNRKWSVYVHFEVQITSPEMPDEEAIKRALKTQIIYNAETNRSLEEFIEDMDWDDPVRE